VSPGSTPRSSAYSRSVTELDTLPTAMIPHEVVERLHGQQYLNTACCFPSLNSTPTILWAAFVFPFRYRKPERNDIIQIPTPTTRELPIVLSNYPRTFAPPSFRLLSVDLRCSASLTHQLSVSVPLGRVRFRFIGYGVLLHVPQPSRHTLFQDVFRTGCFIPVAGVQGLTFCLISNGLD